MQHLIRSNINISWVSLHLANMSSYKKYILIMQTNDLTMDTAITMSNKGLATLYTPITALNVKT